MFSLGSTLEVEPENQEEEERRESCPPAVSPIRMVDVTGIKPLQPLLARQGCIANALT
jgi:hypothetical protein